MILASLARRLWLWAPPVAYLALIFYLSSQSSVPWAVTYPDTLLHAAEYGVLAVLLARALNQGLSRRLTGGRAALAWTMCVLYALSDEFHQVFVPGRTADYRDAIADAAGAALGLLVLLALQQVLGKAGADVHGRPVRAVLYSRARCAPCFAMKRIASRAARRRGVSLAVVDVDSDPGLQRLYGEEVPVIELPGGRLIRGGATAEDLDRAFLEVAGLGSPAPTREPGSTSWSGVTRILEGLKRLLGVGA